MKMRNGINGSTGRLATSVNLRARVGSKVERGNNLQPAKAGLLPSCSPRLQSRGVRVAQMAIGLMALASVSYAAIQQSITVSVELTTKNVRSEESNLANVIADGVMAVRNTDGAFLAAGAFAETTVAKGNAMEMDILNALEYRADAVVVVKLTGQQIKNALEHGLSLYPRRNPAFLQVAGIEAQIDGNAESGKRVTSVRVGGSAADLKKTYRIAMPSPLANGALAFQKIWEPKDIAEETNITVGQAVSNYLKTNRTIGRQSGDRLVIKK